MELPTEPAGMRAKLWDYKRMAWEIADALKKIKYGG